MIRHGMGVVVMGVVVMGVVCCLLKVGSAIEGPVPMAASGHTALERRPGGPQSERINTMKAAFAVRSSVLLLLGHPGGAWVSVVPSSPTRGHFMLPLLYCVQTWYNYPTLSHAASEFLFLTGWPSLGSGEVSNNLCGGYHLVTNKV